MLMIALAAAAATAQPQPLRTFTDWTVGCDNGRACTAVMLLPEEYAWNRDEYLLLTIKRGGAPGAPVVIDWDNDLGDAPVTLLVDNRVVARGVHRGMALTPAMISALRRGNMATLRIGANQTLPASLVGLTASLLLMDEQQGRLGTTTALVRRGNRPLIGTGPALPQIVRPAMSTAAPRTLSVDEARRIIGPDYAVCEESSPPVAVESYRLDAEHSLALIFHPCGNGAYNYFATAMIVDNQGRATPAPFEIDPGMGGEAGAPPGNILVNARYDAEQRVLNAYAKGRGVGDCGTLSDFVWDGTRFALSSLLRMDECRGRINYIEVWRTNVR